MEGADLGRGERASVNRTSRTWKSALIVLQIAISALLMVGSLLLLQSYRKVVLLEPGFEPEGVLSLSVVLPGAQYDSYDHVGDAYLQLVTNLEAVPGVERAAATMTLPMSGFDGCSSIYVWGPGLSADTEPPCVPLYLVSPGYFEAMGIQVSGSPPTWSETLTRSGTAIISRALTSRLWQEDSPLGRGIRLSTKFDPILISGVAGDVLADGLDEPAVEALYLPMLPQLGADLWPPINQFKLVVKTELEDPELLASALRRAVAEFDPRIPISDVATLEEIVSRSTSRLSFFTLLLSTATVVAFLLCVVGVYGVLYYFVVCRHSELGIRMAVGARKAQIQGMILAQALRLAGCGIGLGLALAAVLCRYLTSFLFEIRPRDPETYVLVTCLMLCTAILAAWIPAIRASQLDPIETLRQS